MELQLKTSPAWKCLPICEQLYQYFHMHQHIYHYNIFMQVGRLVKTLLVDTRKVPSSANL